MTQASSLIDQPALSALAYPSTQLFINGQWRDATDGKTLAVFNPATGKEIGRVAHASKADLDKALEAAQNGLCHLARHDRGGAQQDHAQSSRSYARTR